MAVAAVFALLCPAPGVGADAHAATTRPNIVVILTDDQPAQTMWAMPRTQRLLTAHGVKFTSYYDSVSLCCPARAALLTGRYAHSTLVYTNKPPFGGASRSETAATTRRPWPCGFTRRATTRASSAST